MQSERLLPGSGFGEVSARSCADSEDGRPVWSRTKLSFRQGDAGNNAELAVAVDTATRPNSEALESGDSYLDNIFYQDRIRAYGHL